MIEVGLLVDFRPPPHWETLVHAIGRWCAPRVADPATDAPAAWLASSPGAAGLEQVVGRGAPVGVLTMGDGQPVVRVGADADIPFPAGGLDAGASLALTPYVRARWRRRFGLPPRLVVRADGELPEDLVPTALALAGVVVAEGARLVEALAWGAPCVTDERSAAAAGARPGIEVVVADEDRFDAEAEALAADDRRAAALGRAGRRLVERRHDTTGPARAIAHSLALLPPPSGARARIDDQLDALWTPRGARIRVRALEAVAW